MAEEIKKEKPKPLDLSAALKDKFKMKAGFAPGEYRFRGETINTAICTLEEATDAVENGFDVLEAVKSSTNTK